MAPPRKYEILCPLRLGDSPRNFLAFNKGTGGFCRLVVLRLLADVRGTDEVLADKLLSRARECAALLHPSIVAAYEPEVIDGKLYLANEFAAGATLAELAEACRNTHQNLPLGLVLRAGCDAAMSLHFAHTFKDVFGRGRPVFHRALTDKSVLVTFDGATKLVDLAYPLESGRPGSEFASPEQLRGKEVDGRADLFSLGAILHSLVTGRRFPYGQGLGRPKLELPLPSKLNSEATPALDRCLMRALLFDRDRRYATALEFARDLEEAAAPQAFSPERGGALVQRLFGARREQLRTVVAREEGDLITSSYRPAGMLEPGPTRPTPVAPLLSAAAGGLEGGLPTARIRRPDPATSALFGGAAASPPHFERDEDPQTVQFFAPNGLEAGKSSPKPLLPPAEQLVAEPTQSVQTRIVNRRVRSKLLYALLGLGGLSLAGGLMLLRGDRGEPPSGPAPGPSPALLADAGVHADPPDAPAELSVGGVQADAGESDSGSSGVELSTIDRAPADAGVAVRVMAVKKATKRVKKKPKRPSPSPRSR